MTQTRHIPLAASSIVRDTREHGTHNAYNHGCHCAACAAAERVYRLDLAERHGRRSHWRTKERIYTEPRLAEEHVGARTACPACGSVLLAEETVVAWGLRLFCPKESGGCGWIQWRTPDER